MSAPEEPDRGATGERVELVGRVVRREVRAGSRSAHPAPHLVGDDGRAWPLHLVGENAFEQPTLAALDGRRVRVRGVWRNGVLRVEPADLVEAAE